MPEGGLVSGDDGAPDRRLDPADHREGADRSVGNEERMRARGQSAMETHHFPVDVELGGLELVVAVQRHHRRDAHSRFVEEAEESVGGRRRVGAHHVHGVRAEHPHRLQHRERGARRRPARGPRDRRGLGARPVESSNEARTGAGPGDEIAAGLRQLKRGGDQLVLAAGIEDRLEVVAAVRGAERLHRAHLRKAETVHPLLVVARFGILHPARAFPDDLGDDQSQELLLRCAHWSGPPSGVNPPR